MSVTVELTQDEAQAGVDALEFGFGMAGGFEDAELAAHRSLLAKFRALIPIEDAETA